MYTALALYGVFLLAGVALCIAAKDRETDKIESKLQEYLSNTFVDAVRAARHYKVKGHRSIC